MHTHEIETRRELNDDVPGARVVVCVCSCVFVCAQIVPNGSPETVQAQ